MENVAPDKDKFTTPANDPEDIDISFKAGPASRPTSSPAKRGNLGAIKVITAVLGAVFLVCVGLLIFMFLRGSDDTRPEGRPGKEHHIDCLS